MINKSIILTGLLSLTFLFIGCENDIQDVNMVTNGDEPIPLNIVIGGMEDFGDVLSPETRSGETMVQTFVEPLDSTLNTDIDIVTTIEMLPAEKRVQTRANMYDGTYFYMTIFDSTGVEVARNKYQVNGTSAILVSGTTTMLAPGVYKFVCYSYNNQFTPNGYPDVIILPRDDFATFCISKNITSTDNTLNVVFKRQMSRVQIAVSSDNDVATYSKVISSDFYSGLWPIASNSTDYTNIVQYGKVSLELQDGIAQTLIPMAITLPLTIEDLTVGGKNYGTKTVNVPVNFVKRGNYKITINFTKSIEVAGLKWAPGNLKFNGTDYYFDTDQYAAGDFFGWNWYNTLVNQANRTDVYDYNYDPCSKVSPAGTWKTPSKAEFQSLINAGYSQISSPVKAYVFGEKVVLVAAGFRSDDGKFYFVGQAGEYWTSEPLLSGLGAVFAYGEQSDIPSTSWDHWVGYGLNVRCVRK